MGVVFAGRYELVDPLGEGGVGVVWRVWDRRRGTYCAAKVLRQVDATSLLRFIREQSLRLDHPHVLAPTGWAGEDDQVLFTMPMIRGGSVDTLVGDFGPLPPQLTALLLDQLLIALEAIHAEGLVHRDVKPANLLLGATGRERPYLWLGDFGIAAGVDEPRLTKGPYALGTPGYLPPECLRHGWEPDPRADLYSAGMCAVEMITGARPDAQSDPVQALEAASDQLPVPDRLKSVVLRLTAVSLSARTQSAAEARAGLADSGLLQDAAADQLLGDAEVFDQIPPLPQGWNEHGPVSDSQSPEPSPDRYDGASPAATYGEHGEHSGHTAVVGSRPAPTAPADYGPGGYSPDQYSLDAYSPAAVNAPAVQQNAQQKFRASTATRSFLVSFALLLLGLLLLLFTLWVATG